MTTMTKDNGTAASNAWGVVIERIPADDDPRRGKGGSKPGPRHTFFKWCIDNVPVGSRVRAPLFDSDRAALARKKTDRVCNRWRSALTLYKEKHGDVPLEVKERDKQAFVYRMHDGVSRGAL